MPVNQERCKHCRSSKQNDDYRDCNSHATAPSASEIHTLPRELSNLLRSTADLSRQQPSPEMCEVYDGF
jgi:hypothetical protein